MIHNRRVTALVPIKDHSERVAGKNFRDFCGRPLYHHILLTLDKTYAVDEIVVDTDSFRVMQEAPPLSKKIRVIERPASIRGDDVSMNRVIEYDLTQTQADVFVQTHATNPLLKPETIAHALREFIADEDRDSLLAVNEYHSRFYFADGRAVNHDPENLIRTQDLPPIYEENSCLYVFTRESFGQKQRRIGLKPKFFPIARVEATDIDDEFTFRLAELLAMYGRKAEE